MTIVIIQNSHPIFTYHAYSMCIVHNQKCTKLFSKFANCRQIGNIAILRIYTINNYENISVISTHLLQYML